MHNLKVGDKVRLLNVKRKYNSHIRIPIGSTGVVTEVSEDNHEVVEEKTYGGYVTLEYKGEQYCSIYLTEEFRGRDLYRGIQCHIGLPVLTSNSCKIDRYLKYQNIPHIVLDF